MTQSVAHRRDPTRRATYQDVLDAPPNLVAEIINGRLYTHPRPAPRNAIACSALNGVLGSAFHLGTRGPGGWLILFEPELHFGEQVLVPNLAGWRRERMPELPSTAYFSLAPDWVCEVLAPSTRTVDMLLKAPIYADEGVAHLWLIEPTDRTLEAFDLRDGHWLPLASAKDGDAVAICPFDAVTFNLGDLWA